MRILKILYWNLHRKVHQSKGSKCFIKNSILWEFMRWWYDDKKKGEANQGIEVFSIKEVAERSLDDLKENEVRMLVFDIVESFHMVAGNIDKCSISRAWSKERISSFERMKKAWVTHCLDEINIICPHMKYVLIWNMRWLTVIGGTLIKSS